MIERVFRRTRVEPFDPSEVAPLARAWREQLNAPTEFITQAEVEEDGLEVDEGRMLRVSRVDGSYIFVAADRVETIEPVPGGAMLQLTSGRKLMCGQPAREVAARWTSCRLFREAETGIEAS